MTTTAQLTASTSSIVNAMSVRLEEHTLRQCCVALTNDYDAVKALYRYLKGNAWNRDNWTEKLTAQYDYCVGIALTQLIDEFGAKDATANADHLLLAASLVTEIAMVRNA